mmetsp:Transcript_93891/g.169584  ORF Transcript_93891/g.169584 Transcript_93891/m.169584 type:complete len:353 (+) Transcript_93891:22-1080(+)
MLEQLPTLPRPAPVLPLGWSNALPLSIASRNYWPRRAMAAARRPLPRQSWRGLLTICKIAAPLALLQPLRVTAHAARSTSSSYLQRDAKLMTTAEAETWLSENADPRQPKQSEEYLRNNAAYALKARAEVPVAAAVPLELFLHGVLPYRNVDEPVDEWRPGFFQVLAPIAAEAKTLREAVEAVVPRIFTELRASRKVTNEPNATPVVFKANCTPAIMAPISETLHQGYASCTGMSILVVNGLRSVGIPARVVGTPLWNVESGGNHNWVEVWTGEGDDGWQFFDAAPTEKLTLNEAWFVPGNTMHAVKGTKNGIYSSEWTPSDVEYPLTWRDPAINWRAKDRTDYYLALSSSK